jgi:transposase-like protein
MMSQSQNGTIATSLNGRVATGEPDPQTVPQAERRHFSAAYKLRILVEADACAQRGQIGALLRREGLYSSHLDKWRKQRAQGQLGPQKRGRKADPQGAEIARLRQEVARLQGRLLQAETIIEVQKKLAGLLGLVPDGTMDREQPSGRLPKC